MGVSTATRLGSGFLLFVLIARHLGPAEFGHYMFWFSATYLCALLANFGLSNMLLKEMSQRPNEVRQYLATGLVLRLSISGVLLSGAFISAFFVDRPDLLLLLLCANFVEVIADTYFVGYRATGHYANEARIATLLALIQFALVGGVVYAGQNASAIAFAFLCGRILQLVAIRQASKAIFGKIRLPKIDAGLVLAKRAAAYAVDFAFGNFFGNIDSVVLRLLVGVEAVGLFQSGMRLFQGGAQAAPILANVFLPAVARAATDGSDSSRAAKSLQLVFLGFGAFFGLGLSCFADKVVSLAFGADYAALSGLLPWFGLLFFVRFFAASWGLILTANGHQSYRARATAVHLVVMLALGFGLTPSQGLSGWIIAMVLANALLGLLYMIRAISQGVASSSPLMAGATLVGCLLFIPRLI